MFKISVISAVVMSVLSVNSFAASNELPANENENIKQTAQQAPSFDFNIPQKKLGDALVIVAKISGKTLSVDADTIRALFSKPLKGRYSTKQAIELLIKGLPLQLQSVNNSTIAIISAPKQAEVIYQLPMVTVTGEKIERSIQETSAAVTVLAGSDIDQGETRDVYQLVNLIPNTITIPSGIPSIRGVDGRGAANGFLSYQSGARPRVSTSIDGVSESWSGENFGKAGLWDTKQVEIFRGSQSTSQGRNTLGGAVVITTNDPTNYWQGAVRAGVESQDNKAYLAGMISGPLMDNELAFRVAAEAFDGKSFIDYELPGEDEYPFDPAKREYQNVRAKLLWTPAAISDLTAKLTLGSRSEEGQYTHLVTKPFFDYKYSDEYGTRRQETSNTNVNLDIDYQLSSELSAHVLFAKRNFDTQFKGYPNVTWSGDVNEANYTAEARLNFKAEDDSISGVAGIYLYKREQDSLISSWVDLLMDDELNTQALFADFNFSLSQLWSLDLGGRIEKESQKRSFIADYSFDLNEGETMFLPKVGVNYQTSDSTTLGLSFRKGYNGGGGGFNEYTGEYYVFEKEQVSTVELSSRSLFLSDSVIFNTNVFYNEYSDYQTPGYGPSGHYLDYYIASIGEVSSYGAEFELTAQLNSQWRIGANLGVLSSNIDKAAKESPDYKDNELSYAPKITTGVKVDYVTGFGLSLGGDINYISDYYNNLANDESMVSGDYVLVNLNARYEFDSVSLRVYVNNATDEEYIYRYKSPRATLAEVGAPLTVGATLDYRF
ncbi:MAG: TonB-dependent receptor [Alteromonadales bacterium]|nr:TonB-dependent receptor [Alteromonadales bacterium]